MEEIHGENQRLDSVSSGLDKEQEEYCDTGGLSVANHLLWAQTSALMGHGVHLSRAYWA